MNPHIGMMEVNSSKPMDFLSKINDKKVRIYEVDYYPYGDDEAGGGWGSNRLNNSGNPGNRELEDFISALFGGNIDDE